MNHFMCPFDGYYHFFLSLFKNNETEFNQNLCAELRMADEAGYSTVLRMNSYNFGSSIFTSTAQVIVPCEVGQTVGLAMDSPSKLYDDSRHRNQFSGVLVNERLE